MFPVLIGWLMPYLYYSREKLTKLFGSSLLLAKLQWGLLGGEKMLISNTTDNLIILTTTKKQRFILSQIFSKILVQTLDTKSQNAVQLMDRLVLRWNTDSAWLVSDL